MSDMKYCVSSRLSVKANRREIVSGLDDLFADRLETCTNIM